MGGREPGRIGYQSPSQPTHSCNNVSRSFGQCGSPFRKARPRPQINGAHMSGLPNANEWKLGVHIPIGL